MSSTGSDGMQDDVVPTIKDEEHAILLQPTAERSTTGNNTNVTTVNKISNDNATTTTVTACATATTMHNNSTCEPDPNATTSTKSTTAMMMQESSSTTIVNHTTTIESSNEVAPPSANVPILLPPTENDDVTSMETITTASVPVLRDVDIPVTTDTVSAIATTTTTTTDNKTTTTSTNTESRTADDSITNTTNRNNHTTTTTTTNEGITTTKTTTTTNDRPWDFSHRKVILQGIDKFHDVKSATKMISQWFELVPPPPPPPPAPILLPITASSALTDTNTSTLTTTTTTNPFVIDKIKKPPKSNWLIVTLQNESMVSAFIDYINASNFKSRNGKNNVFAKAQQQQRNDRDTDDTTSVNRKRSHSNNADTNHDDDDDDNDKAGDESQNAHNKRQRRSMNESSTTTTSAATAVTIAARRPIAIHELKDRIIPLWKLSRSEQEQYKMKEMIKKCAMKIIQDIKNKFRALEKEKSRSKLTVYPWILQQRCIDIQTIVTAPTPLRNKCELTFGYQYMMMPPTNTIATVPAANATSSEANVSGVENHECWKEVNDGVDDVLGAESDGTDVVDASTTTDIEPIKIPAVGFMVTGWAGGVSYSNTLPNIPHEVSMIVEVMNAFLFTSPLVPYDSTTHTGFWRILTIRTSRRTKECMIVIQHNRCTATEQMVTSTTTTSDDTETTLDVTTIVANEKERLVSLLVQLELPTTPDQTVPTTMKVTSIFFQEFSGLSNPPPEHPVQHAYGTTYITEQLGDCKFQISPGAFFQVNTEGAEILYQLVVDKVREVSFPDPSQTVLFDVCCGTGTIGITCLKAGVVGEVVGVDISVPAITDANRNAVLNGYSTNQSDNDESTDVPITRFIASRAELVLGREIHNAKQRQRKSDDNGGTTTKNEMKFVAVVDPAREGLHADVVKAIRSNQRITRLVYVSCNPTATLVRDAALLCSPPTKRYTGRPFRITSAQPVDMFPLTNHCEMVMTFDRLSEEEM